MPGRVTPGSKTPHQVIVLIGPARSGKTHRLVSEYRQALRPAANGHVGRTLWFSPTSQCASEIRAQLVHGELPAVLDPAVVTFENLADRVLAGSPKPPRRLIPLLERELLRRVVKRALEAKRLTTFAEPAQRSSFVDLLSEHIRELKRHGIEPAAFAKSIGLRGERAQHEELSLIYADYERLLEAHQLCDGEGRQLAVRDALSSDASPPAEHLKLVVADGFTDFTNTQHEILARLAKRAERLVITLPGEGDSSPKERRQRADLFAKSTATLAELRRFHPRLEVEQMPARATSWAAIDHLADNLFRPPRDVGAPTPEAIESLNNLEIVAAAGAQDEVVQIARRIKQQLVDGRARPGDVVVVFRSLRDAAPRVREVFDEFGIPYSLETALPLLSAGLVRTLIELLRLDSENWPFRKLVAAVTNNMLTAFDRPTRAATEWLVRELQIAEGREVLVRRVEQLAEQETAGKIGSSERRNRRTLAAVAAAKMLGRLGDAFDELPHSASPTAWVAALEQLGSRLGIAAFAPSDTVSHENRLAWQRIQMHFSAVERLAVDLGDAAELTRADALHLLIDVAAHDSLPRPHDDVGRVRILSASTARNIEAAHLYLAGLSEQSFPAPERVGRLYSEADYQAFQNVSDQRRAESPPPAVERSDEEMLLFYEVLTRAMQRLTISYPGLDEKAQDLPPSSYVIELERLLDGHATIRRFKPQLSPVAEQLSPLSHAEWRVQAVHRGLTPEHDLGLLAGLIGNSSAKHIAASIDSALRLYALRTNRDAFGPADGLLTSPAIRAQLARRFGPQHLWSPSQWESFARCPFNSLLGDVLQLEPLGELTLETDAARRGSLMHRVLAQVHRDLQNDAGGRAAFSRRDPSLVASAFERALVAELGVEPRAGLDGALEELDRRQIAKWSEQYIEQHATYDQAWQALEQAPLPTYFEFRFGPPRSEESEAEDPRSTAEPFVLDLGKEQIRVTGRIDRIDVGRAGGQTVFNVIDYKSGRRPTLTIEKMASGERLQPPLYVMAAQVLLFGENKGQPLWAGYWSMDKGMTASAQYSLKCYGEDGKAAEQWKSLQENVVATIQRFVSDIRSGNFPVFSSDEHCTSYCNFATVCRIAQVRSLGKQWTSTLDSPF